MQRIELSLSGLVADSLVQLEHAGTKLLVIRAEDKVFAYHDKCPHAFWPLSEGTLKDSILECPGHGWEFDVRNGKCLSTPSYCLTSVSVAVEGDTVRLEWPDNLS